MKDVKDISIRRGPGRPPKPSDEVRSERVVAFVTRRQLDALREIAEARGESVSAVIHRMIGTGLLEDKQRTSGSSNDTRL